MNIPIIVFALDPHRHRILVRTSWSACHNFLSSFSSAKTHVKPLNAVTPTFKKEKSLSI
ncbi:hypothetical protein GRAN_2886 [Granulicella sibirica]|uniref:Uncharacterized protein n=1 Tax=Granulicella sibirica TaxID=2479048 RepID=A0A4Q0T287_9BACT|nr:hypothetical protein GRAN_2886 [Granulicella sibirica]